MEFVWILEPNYEDDVHIDCGYIARNWTPGLKANGLFEFLLSRGKRNQKARGAWTIGTPKYKNKPGEYYPIVIILLPWK